MRRNRTTSDDRTQPLGETPEPAAEPGATAPRDLTHLSRRMIGWSGNLFATAVIIILGLTFGKQVLRWWQGDPPPATVVGTKGELGLGGLGDPSHPLLLAFGDLPYSFDRSVFEGSEEDALTQLRAKCRAAAIAEGVVGKAVIPVDESTLRRFETQEPVERGVDWRIVQNGGPVITVVVLRMAPPESSEESNVAGQRAESVVSWGLGLSSAETEEEASPNRWTLYMCSPRNQAVDSDPDLSLPLPPGSQRMLAAHVQDGGALMGFTSPGSSSSSRQFFDSLFDQRGWERLSNWAQIGGGWHARFQKPNARTCDLQLLGNADGKTTGILTFSAAAQISEK